MDDGDDQFLDECDVSERKGIICNVSHNYLSVPEAAPKTPPPAVGNWRERSMSVPSVEKNILINYHSINSMKRKPNENLIA